MSSSKSTGSHPPDRKTLVRWRGIGHGSLASISAYATMGEVWTPLRNQAADEQLEQTLRAYRTFLHRVHIGVADDSHCEPSWAIELPWQSLCDLGETILQFAIYDVIDAQRCLSLCDQRRGLVLRDAAAGNSAVADPPPANGSAISATAWLDKPSAAIRWDGSTQVPLRPMFFAGPVVSRGRWAAAASR